ncbi:MAG: serine hydrolase [Gammaproteobacteria bacterium]|nr:serine hydrolase [Gammaproteobacteria bacterium]
MHNKTTVRILRLLKTGCICAAVALPGWAYSAGTEVRSIANDAPSLSSDSVMVVDLDSSQVLYAKNADVKRPIASITKLMTAMVTLDAGLPMGEKIRITESDIDTLRNSHSRLRVGTVHTRRELLQLALMSSENRASSALARSYPKGSRAFYAAMNAKAALLGMQNTRFVDATGLNSENTSTAEELVNLVSASLAYPQIREITTTESYEVRQKSVLKYRNSNPLVRNDSWEIGLSKTGYIIPAGHCVAMQARIADRPLVIVLLDAAGRSAIVSDSNRIKGWIEKVAATNALAVQGQKNLAATYTTLALHEIF